MPFPDCKIVHQGITWDLSEFNPIVTWGLIRNIEYFRFAGTPDKKVLDLLDNEETMTVSLKISTSDITAQLNSGSSPSASLRALIVNIRDNTVVGSTSSFIWGDFGTFNVVFKNISLVQSPGEGTLYSLDIVMNVESWSA